MTTTRTQSRGKDLERVAASCLAVWALTLAAPVAAEEQTAGEVRVRLAPNRVCGAGLGFLARDLPQVTAELVPPTGYRIDGTEAVEHSNSTHWTSQRRQYNYLWTGRGQGENEDNTANAGVHVWFHGNLRAVQGGQGGQGATAPVYDVPLVDMNLTPDKSFGRTEDERKDAEPNGGLLLTPNAQDDQGQWVWSTLWQRLKIPSPPSSPSVPDPDHRTSYRDAQKGNLQYQIGNGLILYYRDQRQAPPVWVLATSGVDIPIVRQISNENEQTTSDSELRPDLRVRADGAFTRAARVSAEFTWSAAFSAASLPDAVQGTKVVTKDRVRLVPTGPLAAGEIRLNMRTDPADPETGEVPSFIFPSVWEEANGAQRTEEGKLPMVEYWANRINPDDENVRFQLRIRDENGVSVWGQWLEPTDGDDWKDSGFYGRTNLPDRTDASGTPNVDENGRFKFLDPGNDGQREYTAQLIAYTYGRLEVLGEQSVASFFARKRNRVFFCRTADSPYESWGKAYMWKLYGKTPGDPEVSTDPRDNDLDLFFGPDGMSFAQAYACLTPRSTLYVVTHGAGNSTSISLDGSWYYGFEGPSSADGAKGTGGVGNIFDLTEHAQAHGIARHLLACYTANVHPDYQRSVIESMVNSLQSTVGGGGTVRGYTGLATIAVPQVRPDPATVSTGLTASELTELRRIARLVVRERLSDANIGKWYEQDGTAHDRWVDGASFDFMPTWMSQHSFNNVLSAIPQDLLDTEAITTEALERFTKEDSFTWRVTAVPVHFPYANTTTGGASVELDIPDVQPNQP